MGWFGQRSPGSRSVWVSTANLLWGPQRGRGEADIQHHRSLCLLLQGTFIFEFQPLKAGETFGKLTLHNSDLGYYPYELNLKALPALPEKPVHFQTVLGSGQSIFAKFTNYTRQKTEYYCRVSSPGPTLCPPLSRSLGSEIVGGGQWGAEIGDSYSGPSSSWKLPAGNKSIWKNIRSGFFLTSLISWSVAGGSIAQRWIQRQLFLGEVLFQ